MKYCSRKRHFIIIGCDANAHNLISEYTNINKKSEYFLYFIVGIKVKILNVSTTSTFVTKPRIKAADVRFSSASARNNVKKLKVTFVKL